MRMWVAVMAALVASPAVAADQFDLVCTAKRDRVMHYRIDLISRQYCAGDCKTILQIASITDGLIVFIDVKPANPKDSEMYAEVNRITGAWHTYATFPTINTFPVVNDGGCVAGPYSGFPKAQF